MIVFVCNCHIVYSFHMFSFSQMLNRSHEAFRSRIEEMLRNRAVVCFTPHLGFFCFLRSVPSRLAETNEPYETLACKALASMQCALAYMLATSSE